MPVSLLGMEKADAENYIEGVLYNQKKVGINTDLITEMGFNKKINPILEDFVGVFPLEMKALPTWWKDVIHKFAIDVIGEMREEISEQVNEELESGKVTLKETRLLLDLHAEFKAMTVENFKKGVFGNGRKILKYMVSVAEQIKGKGDYEKSEWFSMYVKSNATASQLSIVSTPSIASHLCISNVFDKPNMSSCQSYEGYASHQAIPGAVLGNIMTEDSLLIYVTGGRMDNIRGLELKHQTMIARTFLRLFSNNTRKCKVCNSDRTAGRKECCFDEKNIEECKDYYIAFDRFYTQDTYFRDVFLTIKEIADAKGIKMVMFDGYSKSKDGGVSNYQVKLGDVFYGITPLGVRKLPSRMMSCKFCGKKKSCKKVENCTQYAICSKQNDGQQDCTVCNIFSGDECSNFFEYYGDNSYERTYSVSRINHVLVKSKLRLVKDIT